MALTLLSRMIINILESDVAEARRGFRDIVCEHRADELQHPRDYEVAAEFFRSMADDVAPMPSDLCELLMVPIGSTYARGADEWLTSVLHAAAAGLVQPRSACPPRAAPSEPRQDDNTVT